MRSRIVIILIGLTALWTLMIGRAAYLQVWPNSRLKALEKRQFETVVTLNSRRGDVLDRNGHELAVSMTSYSLFADPKIVEEPRQTARLLAAHLKTPVKQIEEKLRGHKKRFVWIERRIDEETHDEINKLKIHGLGFIEESSRIYPNDRMLAQTLGFVGGEGQGLEGLELGYNDSLQATQKKVSVRRDARGRPLIVNGQVFNQAPDGNDLQLTIDRELQFLLEQELEQATREHEADSAVGVVLDAQTSEILAMAASPSFDPNRTGDFPPAARRNRVVTDAFEPGSTMKTFLIAGGMSHGLLQPNTKFDCEGGVMKIGKRTIHEAEAHEKFHILTTTEILEHSSNVGAAKIGFKVGDKLLLETLKNFGFGEKTGVDFPGESRGIVQPLPWREHLLANISFGQGIAVTALQVANAYAVIANGGWLRRPYLVKAIYDHESGEVTETKPKTIRRVLDPDVIAKVRLMLMGVTSDDGTGVGARVPGFPVAGKTGTAQKVNPNGRGYLKGGYIASFAGFVPANDPRFVIYVAIDHPRKGYAGGAVAAPIFSRIAKFAVRHAGLAPILITEDNVVPAAARGAASIDEAVAKPTAAQQSATADSRIVPELAGLTLREVLGRISGTGVKIKVRGDGFVVNTVPTAGARVGENKDLEIFLSR